MSNSIAQINAILAPVLFQVIGTTPESLAESVKRAGLESRTEAGIQLASIAIFAAAVNKTVLGEFLMQPGLATARATVVSQFSIKNQANMTALTLLGHCLMLSRFADQVQFAREFKRKMGQSDIWAGNLENGALSEVQRKILSEKAKSINKNSAMLFANGFLKYIGSEPTPMTREEAAFWDVPFTGTIVTPPKQRATRTPSIASSPPNTQNVTLKDGTTVELSTKAYNYYMTINNNDLARLTASVTRDGPDVWSRNYSNLADKDPGMTGGQGSGTVVG